MATEIRDAYLDWVKLSVRDEMHPARTNDDAPEIIADLPDLDGSSRPRHRRDLSPATAAAKEHNPAIRVVARATPGDLVQGPVRWRTATSRRSSTTRCSTVGSWSTPRPPSR